MTKYKEPYKVELINDLPEDSVISFYKQGDFTDLCRGPHLPSTGLIKAFKLTTLAGAYWRGNEKIKCLPVSTARRLSKSGYGRVLYHARRSQKRDHTKLGKELKLFALLNEGKGFPFSFPTE